MYTYKEYSLPYTICFCISGDNILLIQRKKPPYVGKWNGLGGKIESGELPEMAAKREIVEETGLNVFDAKVMYTGIVTWDSFTDDNKKGMYAYLFLFPKGIEPPKKEIHEGILGWKSMEWIVNEENKEVAENIRYFLPEMMTNSEPMLYHCEYLNPKNHNQLTKFTISSLF